MLWCLNNIKKQNEKQEVLYTKYIIQSTKNVKKINPCLHISEIYHRTALPSEVRVALAF